MAAWPLDNGETKPVPATSLSTCSSLCGRERLGLLAPMAVPDQGVTIRGGKVAMALPLLCLDTHTQTQALPQRNLSRHATEPSIPAASPAKQQQQQHGIRCNQGLTSSIPLAQTARTSGCCWQHFPWCLAVCAFCRVFAFESLVAGLLPCRLPVQFVFATLSTHQSRLTLTLTLTLTGPAHHAGFGYREQGDRNADKQKSRQAKKQDETE